MKLDQSQRWGGIRPNTIRPSDECRGYTGEGGPGPSGLFWFLLPDQDEERELGAGRIHVCFPLTAAHSARLGTPLGEALKAQGPQKARLAPLCTLRFARL